MDKIWVLGWDFGYEGKTAPVVAYCSEEEALEEKSLIESNPSATTVYVAEVPLKGADDG